MLENSISLNSLLESHELPFIIINATLNIVGVNKAWEQRFSMPKSEYIGQPCCEDNPDCRHFELFQKLEPYQSIEIQFQNSQLKVRGLPLLDHNGTVYLGETVTQIIVDKNNANTNAMAGSSPEFVNYKKQLTQAAQTSIPVFLIGETGTGKELAAEFIHSRSNKVEQKYVIVDCTILSDDLFESELFGHEKGAFTGATTEKKGLFEIANDGTLFLDEIGELPLALQPKLLRALETGQYRRVGGTKLLKSNVRLICATHRNLNEMVESGEFREDLFYRLSVFPVQIPPLRNRLQDIPEIAQEILKQFGLREGQSYSIEKNALIKLLKHQWPGNIRELKNCLLLATSFCNNNHISEEHITFLQQEKQKTLTNSIQNISSEAVPNPLIQMESDVINSLLQKYQGNRKLVAAEMDISERTLYRKLKRFGLK